MSKGISLSFSAFYLNESIPGHLFLEPSIFVSKTYQWMFSDVEDTGCWALINVIARIVLFLILPIIALLSALLIPIGLICKVIGCSSQPSIPQKKPPDSPTGNPPPVIKKPVGKTPSVETDSSSSQEKITISDEESESPELKGEIVVADNGDCLFESFLTHLLKGKVTQQKIQNERQGTVKWIQENCGKEEELQRHLIQSIIEHYMIKLEKLENEKRLLEANISSMDVLGFNDKDVNDAYERMDAITQELALIEAEISPAIAKAGGAAHSTSLHFDEIAPIGTSYYLPEMKEKGVYGGAAELFALSCRYQKCIKVHWKGASIEEKPFQIMNPQFETAENPAFHFTKTHNHYNPYFS